MNNRCADIGYNSLNKFGEELCGDHIEVVEQGENSMVIVLADGLVGGVLHVAPRTVTVATTSTATTCGVRRSRYLIDQDRSPGRFSGVSSQRA